MTEKELIEIQIAHLQGQIKEKQEKLKELEKIKSPVEEGYKKVFGYYPVTDIGDAYWEYFQKGYEQAQKDYKVGEFQEPEKEPEELMEKLGFVKNSDGNWTAQPLVETAQERGERVHNEMEEAYKKWWGEYPTNTWQVDVNRWDAFQSGYNAAYEEKVSEWKPTPQTPEQVADGLKEAFREAVKQGVVSSSTKSKTLTDLIYRWWEDVFTTHSDWDMETSIANLVDEISLWLPTEHETNSYKWNECIRTIREKLR